MTKKSKRNPDMIESRRRVESRYIRFAEWASELRPERSVGVGGSNRYFNERVRDERMKVAPRVPPSFFQGGGSII